MPLVNKIFRASTDSYPASFDFNGWSLLTATNTLVSAVVSAAPSGLTLGAATVSAATKQVSVNISGGVSGVTYRVTVLASTSGGDTLTGLLDVLTNDDPTAGVVLFPSQLLPFFDGVRAMQLLTDDGDVADDAAAPDADTIDGNVRAFALCQAAWREILQACARGKVYTAAELTDYANDPVRGLDLVQLAADIFWCRLVRRRRYTPDDPQAQAAECKEAQEKLQLLRSGERIFDLTDVVALDGSVYGSQLAEAGAISVGRLGGQRCDDSARRLWGCTGTRAHVRARPTLGDPTEGDCC